MIALLFLKNLGIVAAILIFALSVSKGLLLLGGLIAGKWGEIGMLCGALTGAVILLAAIGTIAELTEESEE